jgi:hypothetical protein
VIDPQPVSIQRWTMRRVELMAGTAFLAVVLLAMFLSTTNNDSAVKTSLEIQSLGCTDLEPLWVQAQAVPSASLVPCVRTPPVGWSVTNVAVNDGRSVITLAHGRRYQLVERQGPDFSAVRFDVFPGGCVTTRIRALASSKAEVTAAAPGILGFTPASSSPRPSSSAPAAGSSSIPRRAAGAGPSVRHPGDAIPPSKLVQLRTLPAGAVVRLHLYVR